MRRSPSSLGECRLPVVEVCLDPRPRGATPPGPGGVKVRRGVLSTRDASKSTPVGEMLPRVGSSSNSRSLSSAGGVERALAAGMWVKELDVELDAAAAEGAAVTEEGAPVAAAAGPDIDAEDALRLCRGLGLKTSAADSRTGILDRVLPAGFSPAGSDGRRELRRMHSTANQRRTLSRRRSRRDLSRFGPNLPSLDLQRRLGTRHQV